MPAKGGRGDHRQSATLAAWREQRSSARQPLPTPACAQPGDLTNPKTRSSPSERWPPRCCAAPWLMMVLSSATTGRPSRSAASTSGVIASPGRLAAAAHCGGGLLHRTGSNQALRQQQVFVRHTALRVQRTRRCCALLAARLACDPVLGAQHCSQLLGDSSCLASVTSLFCALMAAVRAALGVESLAPWVTSANALLLCVFDAGTMPWSLVSGGCAVGRAAASASLHLGLRDPSTHATCTWNGLAPRATAPMRTITSVSLALHPWQPWGRMQAPSPQSSTKHAAACLPSHVRPACRAAEGTEQRE